MTIVNFTPWAGLAGGVLIGVAVVLWLWLYGRVTGISGIFAGAWLDRKADDWAWRWVYLVGLVLGMVIYQWLGRELPGPHFTVDLQVSWPWMLLAGLLVGFGTRLGHGCTSGHGVCGIARLSTRSLVATLTFMVAGFVTVFVIRQLGGL